MWLRRLCDVVDPRGEIATSAPMEESQPPSRQPYAAIQCCHRRKNARLKEGLAHRIARCQHPSSRRLRETNSCFTSLNFCWEGSTVAAHFHAANATSGRLGGCAASLYRPVCHNTARVAALWRGVSSHQYSRQQDEHFCNVEVDHGVRFVTVGRRQSGYLPTFQLTAVRLYRPICSPSLIGSRPAYESDGRRF